MLRHYSRARVLRLLRLLDRSPSSVGQCSFTPG